MLEVKQADLSAWAYLIHCPNCGERLTYHHCKALCAKCGFFQDCNDTLV
jgi:ribosomal protein L37E